MPRLSKAMKDVTSCDKPRLEANILNRGFPNGTTRLVEDQSSERKLTRRTETSKYPEEEKTIVISKVVASEMEIAQTKVVSAILGL